MRAHRRARPRGHSRIRSHRATYKLTALQQRVGHKLARTDGTGRVGHLELLCVSKRRIARVVRRFSTQRTSTHRARQTLKNFSGAPPKHPRVRNITRPGPIPRCARETWRSGRGSGRRRHTATHDTRTRTMSKAAFASLKAVQELRFHLCQTSKGSEGVRNFLLASYKNLKAASPSTPILIREAAGVEGKLYARYDYGVEKNVSLEGLDAKAVEKCLTDLVSSAP